MTYRLEAREVSKVIRGRTILDRVSLQVTEGEVVGFIGPNGAGKTSLIRLLSGLARPTSGEIWISGKRVLGSGSGPEPLGLLPESLGFIEHFSGLRNLLLLASIRRKVGHAEIEETLRKCGLDPTDRRPVSKYSLGMRQRLGLAQALMESPRVLILDEPTNGLDVLGISELRGIIRQQSGSGTAIFLASHLLTEVELACDRVLMVEGGRIIHEVTSGALRHPGQGIFVAVSSEEDWERLATQFDVERSPSYFPGVAGIVRTDFSVPELIRVLVSNEVNVEEVRPRRTTLEEAFLGKVTALR